MITRRELMAGTAASLALSVIAAAARAQTLEELAPEFEKYRGKSLTICTWGGSTGEAMRKGYWAPLEERFGIQVIDDSPPLNPKIVAMVESGDTIWDMADIAAFKSYALGAAGYLEKIDYSNIDTTHLPKSVIHDWGVPSYTYGSPYILRTDRFSDTPQDVTAIFDMETFPGRRGLQDDPVDSVVYGCLAAGMKMSEIYPMTDEKLAVGYAELDKIKAEVVYWKSAAQSQQLIANNDVAQMIIWNGRIASLVDEGVPVHAEWNRAQIGAQTWGIPKGSKNKQLAELVIAWWVAAEHNANLANAVAYGPVNSQSFEDVAEDRRDSIPSGHADETFFVDAIWWGKNYEEQIKRWESWRIG